MTKTRLMAALAIAIVASTGATASPAIDIREDWKNLPAELAAVVQPGTGFSFRYQGEAVGPQLPADWMSGAPTAKGSDLTEVVFTHASGLAVRRVVRAFAEAGAIEYQLYFKNTGAKALEPLTMLNAANVSFAPLLTTGACVVSSGGGAADGTFPPKTFGLRRHCFAQKIVDWGAVELGTAGGRSSDKDLPFFFVHNEDRQTGLFGAFGWSGQWTALIRRVAGSGLLNVRGRLPEVEIALQPGEEIQGPTVLLGLYKGTLADGANLLRRLIRDQYTPKLAGKSFLPIATYDTILNIEGEGFDEALLRKLAVGAADVGQEYFLLDAGWYEGKSWFKSVGNWNGVEKSRLPNGLGPVAEAMRASGLKFGMWFEPERVAEGSQLAREHPDWVLWDYGNAANPWLGIWGEELNLDNKDYMGVRFGLLDYSMPEVQYWVRDLISRYIRDYDLKYIRYDFNIDPLPYWRATDKPGRRGIKELQYIQGFYAVIDAIRERHPDTVLEGCASGGRRIDLEAARRFHTFWISDYFVDPANIRYQLLGLNYFLPASYAYTLYAQHAFVGNDSHADDLGLQSLFAGAMGTAGRLDRWSQESKRQALHHVQIWKKLRRYLVEDYYPLSEQPADLKSWSGWQFHDPKDQSGFIQTFRTETDEASQRFVLHRLDAGARYRFTDLYSGESLEVAGATAMKAGIELTQTVNSSRVLTYMKVLQ